MSFLPVIGLEIHIELKTKSKMFCGCSADYFGHKPNTHVCPVCLGLPGALPVANRKAIEWTVLAGLALNCKIPLFSKFDRKNYFYPDLPKGYQISQYDLPLCKDGYLEFSDQEMIGSLKKGNPRRKRIGIRRVHLEEDTAKMIHTRLRGRERVTLLDFNRSGVPLMEVVTEPDISSPQEAKRFLKKLQQIIRYLQVSDCDMEKGSMRLEANVSVRRVQATELPSYKVEIKNLNSFRFVERALGYEIERQKKLLKQGRTPVQETRGWDEDRQITYSQRWKEEAQDYRYFPEPDLPPIRWERKKLEQLKNSLPELPDAKTRRFLKEYRLNAYQVGLLIETQEKADYFEEAVRVGRKHRLSAKEIANVIINKKIDLKKLLPAELVRILIKKRAGFKISQKKMEKMASRVLESNPKAVEDYRKGKTAAVEFLIGQMLKEVRGKIDPNQARQLLLKLLSS